MYRDVGAENPSRTSWTVSHEEEEEEEEVLSLLRESSVEHGDSRPCAGCSTCASHVVSTGAPAQTPPRSPHKMDAEGAIGVLEALPLAHLVALLGAEAARFGVEGAGKQGNSGPPGRRVFDVRNSCSVTSSYIVSLHHT